MIGNAGAFYGALLGIGASMLSLFSILRVEYERRLGSASRTRSEVLSALGSLLAGAGAAVAFFDPALEYGKEHDPVLWAVLIGLIVGGGVLAWLTYR